MRRVWYVTLLAAACSDATNAPDATTLAVTPSSVTCTVGDRVDLSATLDARAGAVDFTVAGDGIWLAAVRRDRGSATVTCEGVGRGVVTVSAGGRGTLVPFVVRAPAPGLVAVSASPASITLVTGATAGLTATVQTSLANASTAARYASSDTTVAVVDSLFGGVRATGPGSATITARAFADPSARALVPVVVTRGSLLVGGLAANPFAIALQVGDSLRLDVLVFLAPTAPSNTTRAVTFTTSDPFVARVSSSGVVHAVGAGRATVRVSPVAAPALTASVSVTVRDPPP